MRKLLAVIITLLLILTSAAFPLIFLFDKHASALFYLPWIMAGLWASKGFLQHGSNQRYFSFCFALLLFVIAISRAVIGMLWYPVMINGVMLALFASSLWQSQTVVERLARLQEPNLSLHAIRYTRKVTQVWCAVFSLNIVITTGLIIAQSYDYWALYSGIISYLLIGLVMGIEWIIRQQVKKKR